MFIEILMRTMRMKYPEFKSRTFVTSVIFMVFICRGLCAGYSHSWSKYKIEYDHSFSLICDDIATNITDGGTRFSKLYWILPSGKRVTGIVEDDRFYTSGTEPDGWNLTLTGVDEPDFGEYVCILLYPNNTIYSIKLGVNVDGAYFGDLFARYRFQAMVGGIAAGSTLVLITLLCVIHHYRYKEENKDNTSKKVQFHRRPSFTDTYEYENPTAVYTEEMKEIKPKDHQKEIKQLDSNVILRSTNTLNT